PVQDILIDNACPVTHNDNCKRGGRVRAAETVYQCPLGGSETKTFLRCPCCQPLACKSSQSQQYCHHQSARSLSNNRHIYQHPYRYKEHRNKEGIPKELNPVHQCGG